MAKLLHKTDISASSRAHRVVASARLASSQMGRLIELLETDRGPAMRIRGFSEDGDVAGDLMYPWHYLYSPDAGRLFRVMVGSYRKTMEVLDEAELETAA